jgi:chromatin remodeling complex protein RSC6
MAKKHKKEKKSKKEKHSKKEKKHKKHHKSEKETHDKKKKKKGKGKGRGSAMANIKYETSEDLATVLGTKKPVSRGEINRYLWKYIKKHKLQNKKPGKGQYIIPDKKLAKVMGKDELIMFKMGKKINKHVTRIQ